MSCVGTGNGLLCQGGQWLALPLASMSLPPAQGTGLEQQGTGPLHPPARTQPWLERGVPSDHLLGRQQRLSLGLDLTPETKGVAPGQTCPLLSSASALALADPLLLRSLGRTSSSIAFEGWLRAEEG